MNGRLLRLAAVAVVAALGWWLWPTEADRVHARVRTMAQALSSVPGESDLERMTRVATLTSALAPDVVVELNGVRRLEGRDAVLGYARQLLLGQSAFRVATEDVHVRVDGPAASATATLVVVINDDSFHDTELGLIKIDHVWLVRDARITRPLARPAISP